MSAYKTAVFVVLIVNCITKCMFMFMYICSEA